MFDLVKTTTKDKLILHGFFIPGRKNKPVVLYIHGFRGDFYSLDYISEIANKLKQNNTPFLTVQTRGMASDYAISTRDKKFKRYGSDFELLSDAYLDIDGWVKFLDKKGYKKVILCAHSLGCLKTARYMLEGHLKKNIKGLIFLAPPDNIGLTNIHTKENALKYLKEVYKKIRSGKGEDMIPASYLDVIISYKTYANWHSEGDISNIFSFHKKNYTFPVLSKIKIPVIYIIGSKDEFLKIAQIGKASDLIKTLKKYIRDFSGHVITGANHIFENHEIELSELILGFVRKISRSGLK